MEKANIICFYGPPATAKSYVAQQVAKQTGNVYFNFEEFYSKEKAKGILINWISQCKYFSKNLWFSRQKSQAVVVFEHYQKHRFVVYFQSSKDEVDQNIRLLSTRKKRNQNRDELLGYLKQFQFLITVDAVQKGLSNNLQQSSDLIIEAIMNRLRPESLICIVVGPSMTCKTTFAQYISQKFVYNQSNGNLL
ncbi:unnamed protein product [Paramecium octaurelia]|uniref:Uncharacterized protein n=1 Tax=Paramecium octaurelia TaxID=43137 RepID=A0A8S1S076_PAROT|nr:unnamed protein product [Paramecium octaurelia]